MKKNKKDEKERKVFLGTENENLNTENENLNTENENLNVVFDNVVIENENLNVYKDEDFYINIENKNLDIENKDLNEFDLYELLIKQKNEGISTLDGKYYQQANDNSLHGILKSNVKLYRKIDTNWIDSLQHRFNDFKHSPSTLTVVDGVIIVFGIAVVVITFRVLYEKYFKNWFNIEIVEDLDFQEYIVNNATNIASKTMEILENNEEKQIKKLNDFSKIDHVIYEKQKLQQKLEPYIKINNKLYEKNKVLQQIDMYIYKINPIGSYWRDYQKNFIKSHLNFYDNELFSSINSIKNNDVSNINLQFFQTFEKTYEELFENKNVLSIFSIPNISNISNIEEFVDSFNAKFFEIDLNAVKINTEKLKNYSDWNKINDYMVENVKNEFKEFVKNNHIINNNVIINIGTKVSFRIVKNFDININYLPLLNIVFNYIVEWFKR